MCRVGFVRFEMRDGTPTPTKDRRFKIGWWLNTWPNIVLYICYHMLPFSNPLKVSSGLAASPTSLFAAPLRNQTPSRLSWSLEQEREVRPEMMLSPRRSWLQLLRQQWMTWEPCVLAPPATSAPVRTTRTWVRCHGCWWRGETRVIKVKQPKSWAVISYLFLNVFVCFV